MAAASPPHQPVKRARAADFSTPNISLRNYVLIELVAEKRGTAFNWSKNLTFFGTKDAATGSSRKDRAGAKWPATHVSLCAF
jgi:hypothetical protein